MSTENSSALIPLVLSNCSRKKYKLLEVKDSSGAGFEIGRFKFPRWHGRKAEVAGYNQDHCQSVNGEISERFFA